MVPTQQRLFLVGRVTLQRGHLPGWGDVTLPKEVGTVSLPAAQRVPVTHAEREIHVGIGGGVKG